MKVYEIKNIYKIHNLYGFSEPASQKMVIHKLDVDSDILLKTYENDKFMKELKIRECLMEQDMMILKSKLRTHGDLCKYELASARYDSYINSLSFKDLNELWCSYKSGKYGYISI